MLKKASVVTLSIGLVFSELPQQIFETCFDQCKVVRKGEQDLMQLVSVPLQTANGNEWADVAKCIWNEDDKDGFTMTVGATQSDHCSDWLAVDNNSIFTVSKYFEEFEPCIEECTPEWSLSTYTPNVGFILCGEECLLDAIGKSAFVEEYANTFRECENTCKTTFDTALAGESDANKALISASYFSVKECLLGETTECNDYSRDYNPVDLYLQDKLQIGTEYKDCYESCDTLLDFSTLLPLAETFYDCGNTCFNTYYDELVKSDKAKQEQEKKDKENKDKNNTDDGQNNNASILLPAIGMMFLGLFLI